MENGNVYEVVSGNSCALYLYVIQGQTRPAQNQTDLLLGLYAQVDREVAVECPDSCYLGLDAYGGGNWQGQSFAGASAQPGITWLMKNLAVTVTHKSDGTAERVPIHWKWGVEEGFLPAREGIWYLDLPSISPISQVSLSATGCAVGNTLTIYTNRIHSRYTHTLSYQLGETEGELARQVGDSYSWTIPPSVLGAMPDLTQDGCNIICATYDGDTLLGYSFAGFLLRAGQAGQIQAEEGWYTLLPHNTNAVLADWGLYVQSLSAVQAVVDMSKVTIAPGATLKEQTLLVNGRACEGLVSPPLDTAQSVTAELRLTDSRGYTCSVTEEIYPLAYTEPCVAEAAAFRSDGDGNFSDVGNYVYCSGIPVYSALEGRNSGRLEVLLYDMAGNLLKSAGYTGAGVYFGDLSAQITYRAVLQVTDTLGMTGSRSFPIVAQQVAFQIREGGDGAAFGGTATRTDCLEIHWNGLRVGGQPVEDFLVERGTTGIWNWEKYRSGKILLRGSLSGTISCSLNHGSGYVSATLSAALPFTLVTVPVVQVTPVSMGSVPFCLWAWEYADPLTRTPGYRLWTPQGGTVAYRLDMTLWGQLLS